MSIPQLDFQFYWANITWSIIYFIAFYGVFKIWLLPVYKKIKKEQQKDHHNEIALEQLQTKTHNLQENIATKTQETFTQEEKNQFIQNDKARVLLEEYGATKDEELKIIIKNKLLEANDHQDLEWILNNFKDK